MIRSIKENIKENIKNLYNSRSRLFIHWINQRKLRKKYIITYSNQCKYKNGYYIYEFKTSKTSDPNVLI